MTIEIDSELRRLQTIQLEKIKQQFLEEAFAECPEDAKRFEFEDIGEQCLVYPKGEFKIYGFFHYKGDSYRMIVTFWGSTPSRPPGGYERLEHQAESEDKDQGQCIIHSVRLWQNFCCVQRQNARL